MSVKAEYIALLPIYTNNVRAYSVGDELTAHAVEHLGLEVGVDVRPIGEEPGEPVPVSEQVALQVAGVPRPGSHGTKPEWVAYAEYRGMPRPVAEDSTIAQLADFDYDINYGPDPNEA